jgi:uncharacterized membrane protein YoaK (UPF0700 family)
MSKRQHPAEAANDVMLPHWVPALLALVAGYVDIYTFLALFGLFVAQVTGSFVTAGAELVTHDIGILGKVMAFVAFLVAAASTAGLIALARERHLAPLPWMLALETVWLAVFTLLLIAGPPVTGADDWHGILAGVFGAMAMGTQSVLVRLLMKGMPQTNVMTGNMTQLGIEVTALILAWRGLRRDGTDTASRAEFHAARSRLATVLAIAIGFVLGAAIGAASYGRAGLAGAPLAVILVGAVTLWSAWREWGQASKAPRK